MTTTTWTQCLRIERTDGTVYGMTTLDKDISYGGLTYSAAIGYDDLDFETTALLSVNNSNIEGFFAQLGFNKADVVAGLFDFAEVQCFYLDYVGGTKIKDLFRGWLGETSFTDGAYVAELRSLSQVLQQSIGRVYGVECDRDLGDSKCGVNLASWTDSGTITSVTSHKKFAASALPDTHTSDDYYNYGLVTFTSGNNNEQQREVKNYVDATGELTTFLEFPFEIEVGDTFTVYKGCSKTDTSCKTFSNIKNFRGSDRDWETLRR